MTRGRPFEAIDDFEALVEGTVTDPVNHIADVIPGSKRIVSLYKEHNITMKEYKSPIKEHNMPIK